MINRASDEIARLGVAYCPEERGVFASLSVEENLFLPPVVHRGGMGVGEILVLFPNLKERLHSVGTKLSGGEQQMLANARILRTGATMLHVAVGRTDGRSCADHRAADCASSGA